MCVLSHVQLFVVLWTVACQGPLSMETSRQLPFPTPGDFPNPGIEPTSLASPALAGGFFTTSTTWEACSKFLLSIGFSKCPMDLQESPGSKYYSSPESEDMIIKHYFVKPT